MSMFSQRVPDFVAGIFYLVFGLIVLLDAWDWIHEDFLVTIGAAALTIYGFVLVGGPEIFNRLFKSNNRNKPNNFS